MFLDSIKFWIIIKFYQNKNLNLNRKLQINKINTINISHIYGSFQEIMMNSQLF